MKKMIFAALLGVFSIATIEARLFDRGCCPTPACEPSYAPVEPTPPVCTKTVMVNQVIQVPKCVQVPANRIVIKQPPVCERIKQPAKCIRIPRPPLVIPQPDEVRYECQPDKIVYHAQPDVIRYECPTGCDNGRGLFSRRSANCCR